jgi:putative transposase
LAVVLDLFNREVVGWSIRSTMSTQIAIDALKMACLRRKPETGVIHHSDRGSQGEFNRSSQQSLMQAMIDVRVAFRQEFSNRELCETDY